MDSFGNYNPFPNPNRNVLRVFSAVIEEISRDRNTTLVTIAYNDCIGCGRSSGSVRLVVNQDTTIQDERGRNIRAGELRRGMSVDASFSSTMTRSIPPQAQAYFIRMVRRENQTLTSTGRLIDVNTRNNFIMVLQGQNPTLAVRYNVSPSTVILDVFGRRTSLSSLIPGFRVRIEHASFMTASIPPQTTAFTIQMIR